MGGTLNPGNNIYLNLEPDTRARDRPPFSGPWARAGKVGGRHWREMFLGLLLGYPDRSLRPSLDVQLPGEVIAGGRPSAVSFSAKAGSPQRHRGTEKKKFSVSQCLRG